MTVARFENGKRVIQKWDAVFNALSAEPRRQLIVSLLDAPSDRDVSLPESAVNPNVPPDPDTLRMELRHHHLPMLSDFGFVEWDTDPLVASRGPQFAEAAVVFEALHATAADIPESLVVGCQRLEREQGMGADGEGETMRDRPEDS